jgi:hypothetical protein
MRPQSTANEQPTQRSEMRRGEFFLWLPWALGTLLLSIRVVGAKLFLIYLYGLSKVQNEHLQILSMPKGRPWPLSNGQVISEAHFVHYLISVGCWFAMFFATYPLVRLLLPPARRPVA